MAGTLAELFKEHIAYDEATVKAFTDEEFETAKSNWLLIKLGQALSLAITDVAELSEKSNYKGLLDDLTVMHHAAGSSLIHAFVWAAKNPEAVVKLERLLGCSNGEPCTLNNFYEEMATESVSFLAAYLQPH